jgi:amino acid adenylation domain-containing protein
MTQPQNLSYTERFSTLVDLLRYRAQHQPDDRAFTFLLDGELDEAHISFAELDTQARAIAATLQQHNALNNRVLLLYSPGLDFIAAFMGCLYAGAVAVPAYPPRLNRPMPRIHAIVSDADARIILTDTKILSGLQRRFVHEPELAKLQWIATDGLAENVSELWQEQVLLPETLAFLQYTSGSTGIPKGVMLSHANLLHNQKVIQQGFGHSDGVGVSWLPLYHDMGLIGHVIHPIYMGKLCVLLSPVDFLQKPIRWLQAISRYGGTTSGGPNFAYQFSVEKTTPEQREGLDLSGWTTAYTGAEAIRADTLNAFSKTFEPYGFKHTAFYPCYGLAEATLMVTSSDSSLGPVTQYVKREALEQGDIVEEDASNDGAISLVGCGNVSFDQKILIVDPETQIECDPNKVGEIWVSGESIANGYWQRPEQTEHDFQAYIADSDDGPFLRTGDLGFVKDDQLYVTGRLKDLIIIRGRNHYPDDIEYTVAKAHPALEEGSGAAFSVDVDGEEQLVIVYELKRSHRDADVKEVAQAVRRVVFEEHILSVYALVLVRPMSIPKTSSGKIQRHACRDGFLKGELNVIGEDILTKANGFHNQETTTSSVEPRNPTESKVVDIWCEVLALGDVGIHDNFFELGGHSLLATQVITRLQDAFAVELSLQTLFESPTPAAIAEHISAALESSQHLQVPPIEPIQRNGNLPLSYSQERMWFLYRFEPDSSAYNVLAGIRLKGNLNVSALQQTFNEIVQRHESLRTTFPTIDGSPGQIISASRQHDVPVIDLREYPQVDREDRAIALASQETQKPFNLEKDPLLRSTIFRVEDEEFIAVVVMHHIISDAWSVSVLWQEIAAYYSAFYHDKPVELPDMPIQMVDFAHWQRDWLQGTRLQDQLAYWKKQLAAAPTILELPTDYPRPPIQTYHGENYFLTLSPELLNNVKELSKGQSVTPFMTLLAVFNLLLYYYTGQDDILVATPIANRQWLRAETLIGTFVNTLVMRTDLSKNPTFRELLKRVREMALNAYLNQDFPFERLVEEVQPERTASHSPLVQVMFSLANAPMPTISLPDLEWEVLDIDGGAAQFDLTLVMVDTTDVQATSIVYNTDLFKRETIARMADQLVMLLELVTENPDHQLSEISILSEKERQLMATWNATERAYPSDSCLHQLIEAQAERTPDATAVIFEGQKLSYRDLNSRANQLAHHLQKLGVIAESVVGIHLERSLEMMIALLGVMKAGGTYVPLDPAFPKNRLDMIVEEAKVHVLLSQHDLADNLAVGDAPVLALDTGWDTISEEPDDNPISGTIPDNLLYIIFTSGSTGKPKGVQLEHRSVVNFLNSMHREPGLIPDDVLLTVTTLSFDIAVLELYLPLMIGATVVIPTRETTLDGNKLMRLMEDTNTTVMQATPATWQILLEAGWHGKEDLKALCGGEAIPLELVDKLLPRVASLWNMYGPTETTVWSTTGKLTQAEGFIPIGKPIDNTTVHILDEWLRPVPIGVPGELHIGGDGLARGYHNRPDLTAEKFIPDPFSHKTDARLYKTGDLARFLPNGTIQFFGRMDNQVKVRGFRIELGEIETILDRQSDVRQNVVVVREDKPGDKRLVAYIIAEDSRTLDMARLRESLHETLPQYMIPSAFVELDSFPLTPNGKINRRALPPPDPTMFETVETYVAPRNATEAKLAKIWEEVLQLERVGIHDNFFDLGGHSLLAVRLFSQIEKTFDKQLPLATLFRSPTVAYLAELLHVEPEERSAVWEPIIEIQPNGSKTPFFCVGGNLLLLANLARGLGNDQPFYGLQTESLRGTEMLHPKMDQIALRFIDAIRAIQPHGPYFVSGCFGSAMVALEMARQLELQGEKVALVGVFDYIPKRKTRSLIRRVGRRLSKLPLIVLRPFVTTNKRHTIEMRPFVDGDQPIIINWLHLREYIEAKLWKVVFKFFQLFDRPLPRMFRGGTYEEMLMRYAASLHKPGQSYQGNITVFLTSAWYQRAQYKAQWGWTGLVAGEIDAQEVPGDPCTMFLEPHVESLILEVKERVELTQARVRRQNK